MKRHYGQYKIPEDETKCRESVWAHSMSMQCSRKRGFGPGKGYCRQHARRLVEREEIRRRDMELKKRRDAWSAKVKALPKAERVTLIDLIQEKSARRLELNRLLRHLRPIVVLERTPPYYGEIETLLKASADLVSKVKLELRRLDEWLLENDCPVE